MPPAKTQKREVSNSKLAQFARSCDGACTPWINAAWVDELGNDVAVIYRLWIKRRGKALFVGMHERSPLAPGKVQIIRPSKPGTFEMRHAGRALVNMARWDPNRPAALPRAVWEPKAKNYELRLDYARTVSLSLPRLMTPSRGRPKANANVSPHLPISLRGGGRTAARRTRRQDLLNLTERLEVLLGPISEIIHNAQRMSGYTAPEQSRIREIFAAIERNNKVLHAGAFFDVFHLSDNEILRTSKPAARREVVRPNAVEQEIMQPEGFEVELIEGLRDDPQPDQSPLP